MSKPRYSTVRGFLFAGGVVLIGIVGKVAILGLGADTFRIAVWELVLLAVVGVALIAIGWRRTTRHSTDLEDGLTDDDL